MKLVSTKTGFNLISPIYDLTKEIVFQNKIDTTQHYFLNQVPLSGNQLIIGGGTGKYLIEVLNHKNINKIVYLDISDRMIRSAQKKLLQYSPNLQHKVTFVTDSFLDFEFSSSFNNIHTPFILDCLNKEDLNAFLKKIKLLLDKKGTLYFSDFCNKNTDFSYQLIIRLLYTGFNPFINSGDTSLPDFKHFFSIHHFKLLNEKYLFDGKMQTSILSSEDLH